MGACPLLLGTEENIFQVQNEEERVKLDDKWSQCFHSKVAQPLYVTMQCRREISIAVAFLTTRVKEPDEDDWAKPRSVLKYLHGSVYLSLTWDASEMNLVQWWVDTLFAVHSDD